jgi:hypothetical protein
MTPMATHSRSQIVVRLVVTPSADLPQVSVTESGT